MVSGLILLVFHQAVRVVLIGDVFEGVQFFAVCGRNGRSAIETGFVQFWSNANYGSEFQSCVHLRRYCNLLCCLGFCKVASAIID